MAFPPWPVFMTSIFSAQPVQSLLLAGDLVFENQGLTDVCFTIGPDQDCDMVVHVILLTLVL